MLPMNSRTPLFESLGEKLTVAWIAGPHNNDNPTGVYTYFIQEVKRPVLISLKNLLLNTKQKYSMIIPIVQFWLNQVRVIMTIGEVLLAVLKIRQQACHYF